MKRVRKLLGVVVALGVVLGGCSSGTSATEESAEKEPPQEINIYFTRHGKTMLNTADRSQGWSDAPLTPSGIEVAEDVGKGIGKKITFDKVYSSDSGRAIETAELIIENAGQKAEISKDKRLREFNFGTFEGMPGEEVQKLVAESNGQTLEDAYSSMENDGFIKYIQGFSDDLAKLDKDQVEEGVNWPAENYQAVTKRAMKALDQIVSDAKKNGDDSILIVSHGMTIVSMLNEIDPEVSEKVPSSGLKNASISKVTYKNGKATIKSVNDLSYAEKGSKLK